MAKISISVDEKFVRLEVGDALVFALSIEALREHPELYSAVKNALKEYFSDVLGDLDATVRLQG